MENIGTRLLDFSQPFDVALLDQVVMAMNDPSHAQRSVANQIMVALQEHQDAWNKVCDILENSTNLATKFFGLQILEDAVKYRWKILPLDQREGIKSYIVNKILQLSSDEKILQTQRTMIHKMDLVLVQILKHEWPHNWPTFITDIVNSSKTSEVLCENNMFILKLLSEEIFDFSKDQLTLQKTKNLKESLNQEFTQIFQLCEFVLDKSQRVPLISITLQTLLRFLSWIPLGYIFETQLILVLTNKFLPTAAFRNDTLSCLTEIAQLTDVPDQYKTVFQTLYVNALRQLETVVPVGSSYINAFDQDEVFVQRLALFFTSFYRNHIDVIEKPIQSLGDEAHQSLTTGFTHLVNISEVFDESIFKICLDYWHFFTKELYTGESGSMMTPVLRLGGMNTLSADSRKSLFANILSRVRLVMISQMVKPSEVLIVEDENGEIVRETTKDTEALSQYKTMHETLVYLTHLDYEDTENIMLEKLAFQVDGTEWSWNNLNTLCWAIGSISGAMAEEDEKRFLVTVIKDLLGLCEMKRGKDNKAVVASNIMYVVGQYPRFLRAHWKFLKTVVNKLFEFMHETHPGVQDMACDTFLKISQKCRRKFVTLQTGENQAFVEDLLVQLPTIVSDLQTHQVHSFYESVGSMLVAETNDSRKHQLLKQLMELPNGAWSGIMAGAAADVRMLFDQGTIKEVNKILKTNVCVCKSIGAGFSSQMINIFNDLMNVHKAYSAEIENFVAKGGPISVKSAEVRAMRSVKREVLCLIQTFVEVSNDKRMMLDQFMPAMLSPILTNYKSSLPAARDSEVLKLMAICIDQLKEDMGRYVMEILEAVFECTLEMITKNFEDFPEHRINFFHLLKAVNSHCFQALFSIPPEHQKLVVDSIVWAFKHTERNIADAGLETLNSLLINVQQNPTIAQGFYRSFYLSLMQDILAVLTDRLHKFGFKMHSTILKHMFTLAESNQITVPLWESVPNAAPTPGQNNPEFLKQYVAKMIETSFPNLSAAQVTAFVTGCFDITKDLPWFKNHLRDFLINIKEFAGEDNAALYLEEQMVQNEMKAQQELKTKLAVPGLVGSNDRPDDMDDL